jgi:hypothetical protein
MTYPPQQPDPYGSQQPPDPYGQRPSPYSGQPPQSDPFRQQSGYQGLGTYPTGPSEPPPPKKSNTGTIIAIVLVALLVLGGGGTAVYFLTKKKDDSSTSASNNQPGNTNTSSPKTSGGQGGSDDTTSASEPPSGRGSDSPDEVQQAYIAAYESKKFGPVVNSACDAYKKKFGTDTTDLEKQLAPYDIKATADGTPSVDGSTATAKINLELTKGSETKKPKIQIKIVKESGSWKFCGEGEA